MSRNHSFTPRSGGFGRRPRVADSMTPDLYACVQRARDAECAGDLEAALEWHCSVPMYLKGRHTWVLDQLVRLGDELPEWVWARLLAYLATRCEEGLIAPILHRACEDVVDEVHFDLLEDCYRDEGDPIKVAARVLGESWPLHQLVVHEGGALTAFIDEFACDRLAEHTDLARRWAGARMGGYQVGDSVPGARLRVREAHGDWIEVLDLGARSCTTTGWVLGRLVPSGVDDLPMFDMPPLEVPRAVAEEVALRPDGDWWLVVSDAVADDEMAGGDFLREDYQLTTDVLDLELLRFGTRPRDLGRVMQELRGGRDEVSPAAYRTLVRAQRGEIDPADQAYVAAAVLNARAFDDTLRDVARSGETAGWADWRDRVAEPARGRLLRLADAGRSAA